MSATAGSTVYAVRYALPKLPLAISFIRKPLYEIAFNIRIKEL
jgi:hypothetical protein